MVGGGFSHNLLILGVGRVLKGTYTWKTSAEQMTTKARGMDYEGGKWERLMEGAGKERVRIACAFYFLFAEKI